MTDEDPIDPMIDLARQMLARQVEANGVRHTDARIARLREWGMHQRANNLLIARIKVFGEPKP